MIFDYLKMSLSLCFYVLLFVNNSIAQDSFKEKHLEVALRMVGHQVLLISGDSTSRVLPIIRENNQYKVEFASEFAFNPDDLVNTIDRNLKEINILQNYIVEVEDCESLEVVYSFEIGKTQDTDITPCRTRPMPKACYRLLLSLSNVGIFKDSMSEHTALITDSISETSTFSNSYITFILIVIGSIIFFYFNKKKSRNDGLEVISIGQFKFDKIKTELLHNEMRIELTSKESELLNLLFENVNNIVARDNILRKVWKDEGDYIGRTLDVFISKLRKKLEYDPEVKIVNIRGVGYKLVANS